MKDLNCTIHFNKNDKKIFSIRCNDRVFNDLIVLVNSYFSEISKS